MLDEPVIKAKRLTGQRWYEIDDIQDLDIAESIFTSNEDARVKLIYKRNGGYWRYSNLIDFYHLSNPYFPPKRMIDEIQASFTSLLTQYPSDVCVNSLLAAKNFDVHEENILVGNGVTELIKCLMKIIPGKVGIVCQTFEEYLHKRPEEEIVAFWPTNDNYSYTCIDLMGFFKDKDISALIIINPDNLSGNYMEKKELFQLIEWTKKRGIVF